MVTCYSSHRTRTRLHDQLSLQKGGGWGLQGWAAGSCAALQGETAVNQPERTDASRQRCAQTTQHRQGPDSSGSARHSLQPFYQKPRFILMNFRAIKQHIPDAQTGQ